MGDPLRPVKGRGEELKLSLWMEQLSRQKWMAAALQHHSRVPCKDSGEEKPPSQQILAVYAVTDFVQEKKPNVKIYTDYGYW